MITRAVAADVLVTAFDEVFSDYAYMRGRNADIYM